MYNIHVMYETLHRKNVDNVKNLNSSTFDEQFLLIKWLQKQPGDISFGSRWVEDFDGAKVIHIVVKIEFATIPAMRNLHHHREVPVVKLVFDCYNHLAEQD